MGTIKLGQYAVNLHDILGRGGFGIVYSGTDEKAGTKVAVKKIKIVKDEDGYMAMQEIKHFDRLPAHPNLIRLLDFHYKDRAFWMVMDFCDAGDLDVYVCENNPDLGEKLSLMFQCACAIAHMHSASPPVVHRDVKPANVLLFRESGGNIVAKLSDFGLSKMAQTAAATAMFATAAGTPGYLAPEVFQSKPYNLSVDVFSLGLVFLAMIQHKEDEEFLAPRTEKGPNMLPIGVEMYNAAQYKQSQPTLVSITESDKSDLKKLKAVILNMVVYEPKDRLSAIKVMQILGEITGLRPVTQGAAGATSEPSASNDKPGDDEAEVSLSGRLLEEALRERVRKQKKKSIDEGRKRKESAGEETSGHELVGLLELLRIALGGDGSSGEQKKFGVGERVRVESSEGKVVRLQEDHGGWSNNMKQYLGKVGIVKQKLDKVVKVQFSDGKVWSYNPALLQSCDDGTEVDEDASQPFKRYDVVSIEKDPRTAKNLQDGHGGWNPKMSAVLGLKGIVNKVDGDRDVLVECINSTKWFFNPKLLTIVDTSGMTFQDGDFVLVIDSFQEVKALQDSAHGGWNEKMRETLGKAGIVSGVLSNGRIRIRMGSRPWVYNKQALRLIAKSEEMMQAVLQSD